MDSIALIRFRNRFPLHTFQIHIHDGTTVIVTEAIGIATQRPSPYSVDYNREKLNVIAQVSTSVTLD
jgi:hypothetical protein